MQLQAKKSLGQHFLNSKHALEEIIKASGLKKGDTVVEIGPGTGILTEALLKTGANIIAIEKDDRAIELLATKFKDSIISSANEQGQLNLIHSDILDNSSYEIPQKTYSIVANIPYYITGAILEKFLEEENRPIRMVLLVQKEVADRIVAKNDKESILSLSVKAFGKPKIIAKVPRGAFNPPPKVDSAILAIEEISDSLFVENNIKISDFFSVIKAGFAHKRKLAIRNLESLLEKEKLEKVWQELSLDFKLRAEDISIKNWLLITKRSFLK